MLLQNDTRSDREAPVPAPTPAPAPPESGPAVAGTRRVQALTAVVVAVVMFLRPTAPTFIYDAKDYFEGALATLTGGSTFEAGQLSVRGILTSFLYLPAALVTYIGGDELAGVAVLAENAVLIALVGTVLLPLLVAIWRPVTPAVIIVCGIGAGVAMAGFAPYPLSDIWGAALVLIAVVALNRHNGWWLLVAGLAAGAAFNIRPATMLPLVAMGVAVVIGRRGAATGFALGGVLALLPQWLLNRWRGTLWTPVPERTGWLTELQATYAPFLVRYDTTNNDPMARPSVAYCSPSMAKSLDGVTPSSPGELAGTYLGHMPQSLVLSVQKIGAGLHWPLSTPYLTPAPVVNSLFAVLVTTVTVIGVAALLRRSLGRGRGMTLGQVVGLLALAGSVVGLVTSATETRFALSVVLFGIVGCACLVEDGLRLPRTRAARYWVAGTLLVVVVLYVAGVMGMAYPYDGLVSLEICAGF